MAVDSATRAVAIPPGTKPVRRPRFARRRRRTWIWNTVAVVFALIMFFPVYWMVATAFKPSNEVLTFHPNLLPLHATIENFTSAINAPDFLTDLRNSVVITVVSVVLGLIVGFLGALALARFIFAGRRAVILVLLGVQMVPAIAIIIPIYLQLQRWHQTNQLSGVILSYIVVLMPFTIWMLRGFIANVPRELDEAAL
ncbi:MAG TPA: carbohydrate ABC transporter permease, partial [Micromonosporaceae bacterium]|nr:carbohydrate ABC transporter permease [Micromonosporaceae bacterium]